MRWLLAVLFTLNVLLFLWIQTNPEQQSHARVTDATDFGEIRLLRELEPAARTENSEPENTLDSTSDSSVADSEAVQRPPAGNEKAVDENRSAPPVPSDTSFSVDTANAKEYCGEIGPFPSRNMAEGYRRKLAANKGAKAELESRRGKVTVGYWVMIPPLADTKQAEQMLKKLREAGFNDLWLMRKGEHANGISMGLYTEERYAKRHADNILTKGFETRLVPKLKNARLFWVQFSQVGTAAMQELAESKFPQGVSLQKKVCSQGSAGN